MKQLSVLLWCLITTLPAFSQSFTLQGRVVSKADKSPIPGASILLQARTDTTRKFQTASGPDGHFRLMLPPGEYTLQTGSFNFTRQSRTLAITADLDLGNVMLTEDVRQLGTVEVQGERSTIELKTDKKVFNVGKDILSKGGNANDVLNNVPAVNVDIRGNISLRDNPNVRILINGKPSMQTQNNGLSQIPASNIEKIEVITNPSSAYEAQGSAGIINIILKKNASQGFNASLQAGLASPKNSSINLNASYKTSAVNLFTNIGYRDQSLLFLEEIERVNKNPYALLRQNNRADLDFDNINLFVGTDFYLNPFNTLTASFYRTKVNNFSRTAYDYRYFDKTGKQDSAIDRFENYREPQVFNEIELSYARTYKQPGRKWTTYLQYDFWNDDENQQIRETNPAAGTHDIITRDIESSKDLYLQSDYKLPVKTGQLDMGVRGQWRAIRSEYSAAQDGLPMEGYNNKLYYDENIYAAYTQYGTKWKQLEGQIGLRGELSHIHISDRAQTLNNRKRYLDLFPTLHLQYALKNAWALQASYSRRINRPRFWQLNTFGGLSDQRFLQRGNPDIDPMYTSSLELAVLKQAGKLTINPGIYYQYTSNYFGAVIAPAGDGTFLRTWANMGVERRYGADISATYNPRSWWRLSWDINAYAYSQRGEHAGQVLKVDNTMWFTTLRSGMRFPKVMNIDGSFTYRGRQQELQVLVSEQYRANIGLSRDFLGDRLSLSFSVNNIFNSNINEGELDAPGYSMYSYTRQEGVVFTGTAVYRLNRKKGQADRMPAAK